MICLLLAVCSSVLVSVLLRMGEKQVKNTFLMFFANYLVCCLASMAFVLPGGVPTVPGMGYALTLGVIGGGMYLLTFVLLQTSIRKNGMVLSSFFMKLGVLVPTVLAILVFRERPGVMQLAGFALAIGAIVLIQLDKTEEARTAAVLLPVLLLVGGLTDSFVNIYDKTGAGEWKDCFLLFIFVTAGILCLILAAVQKKPFGAVDFLWGAAVGIPNYFSSRFLLLALGRLNAVTAYPVYNAGALALITLIGVLCFRESLSKRKMVGILLILVSLVLLT